MLTNLTSDELGSTFRIVFNNASGTAFLRHGEDGSYFVTAAHNLTNAQVGDTILFQRDSDWHGATISCLLFDEEGYDVCVFSASNVIVGKHEAPSRPPRGVCLGEPLKFLGFPHGLTNTFAGNGYPPPLVRNAFFSGTVQIGPHNVLILDGFNNPGYSGGPVYEFDAKGMPRLFGVISGYRPENPSHGGIYRIGDKGFEERLPDLYTKPNSGMIIAISMFFVDRLANEIKVFNPAS